MDTVSHLVAGALTPIAFRRAPRRAALVVFGILAGELPDIDIFFGGGSPQALFTLHRGITHALVWQPIMALMLVLPWYCILERNAPGVPQLPGISGGTGMPPTFAHGMPGDASAPARFGLGALFCAALLALYVHIYLDCMTTFGTRIFLPFSDMRVGFASMFIVDLLLTLPAGALLIAALVQKPEYLTASPGSGHGAASSPAFSGRARFLARLALGWMLIYPLCNLAGNTLFAQFLSPRLAQGKDARLELITEPFSPFVWKAVIDDGPSWRMGTVFLASGGNTGDMRSYAKADPALLRRISGELPVFAEFVPFCDFMTQETRPAPAQANKAYGVPVTEYTFSDLRYVISPQSPARTFGRTDTNFIMEVRMSPAGHVLAWRFLQRGARSDVPWQNR